jgi:hypothetical protein
MTVITTALIVILACGYGLGHMVASRRGAELPPVVPVASLEEETLVSLRAALDLTPAQEELIRDDLRAVTGEVFDTRERAVLEYHLHMVRLHDRIAPKLDKRQQEILMKNRERLQLTIENRFSSLLRELNPDGGVPGGKEEAE